MLFVSHIDGLVQERCNSSALAMEFCLSCTNASTWPNWWIDTDTAYYINAYMNFHRKNNLYLYRFMKLQKFIKWYGKLSTTIQQISLHLSVFISAILETWDIYLSRGPGK